MKKITVVLITAILALTIATPSVIAVGESAANDTDMLTNTTDGQGANTNDQGVIDPEITWNTFVGGSGNDDGYGIAVDSIGNVYVTGKSQATWGSPVQAYTSGGDAFVAKIDSSGDLTWNTFLGGDSYDQGNGIAVDSIGNVYVTGKSQATWGSPVQAYTSDSNAFVAKLDGSNGNLTWNTFMGSSYADSGLGIAVDSSGNVYVTGESDETWGSPVRAYASDRDAFVAKLDGSSGNLTWNTFLGGSGNDHGYGITVDSSENVYVTGYSSATWGSPIRAYAGGNFDAFVAKVDGSNGNFTWNTFLGGSGDYDLGLGIAVDGSGNVYITGDSNATWGSPVRAYAGGDRDAFAARLDGSGNLTWNTFLGGDDWDYGYGIAVDSSGNVYVTGTSGTMWGSPVRAYASGYDAFVAKLNGSGDLARNTFLGGNCSEIGYDIDVDGSGNIYVTGSSCATWGSPVQAYTSGDDALAEGDTFVVKLSNALSFEPDNGNDLWVWFAAGGGIILLVIGGILIRRRMAQKKA